MMALNTSCGIEVSEKFVSIFKAAAKIIHSAKALAAIRNRDFVTPDDIIAVAIPVLAHRILLTPEKEMEGITTTDVVNQIIKKLEIPR